MVYSIIWENLDLHSCFVFAHVSICIISHASCCQQSTAGPFSCLMDGAFTLNSIIFTQPSLSFCTMHLVSKDTCGCLGMMLGFTWRWRHPRSLWESRFEWLEHGRFQCLRTWFFFFFFRKENFLHKLIPTSAPSQWKSLRGEVGSGPTEPHCAYVCGGCMYTYMYKCAYICARLCVYADVCEHEIVCPGVDESACAGCVCLCVCVVCVSTPASL